MFILVWKGRGWVVPVLFFSLIVAVQLTVNAVFGPGTYEGHSNGFFGLGCVLAAAALWGLRETWLAPGEPQKFTHEGTGQTVTFVRRHTFMFLDAKYWTYIFLALGAVLLAVEALSRS